MEPQQRAGGAGQVQSQVGDAEQAGESWERVRSALHIPLHEDVQRALERNDPTCVPSASAVSPTTRPRASS